MSDIQEEKMKIVSAEFIKSAVEPKDYPKEDFPQIAFIGRSNVGKSSLLNVIVNRKNLAKTSSTPGKTRTVNFFLINKNLYFVDLPGYGYAKVSKSMKSVWARKLEQYFSNANIKMGIILIDVRRIPNEDDLLMKEFMESRNIPYVFIITKSDKVSKSQYLRNLKEIMSALNVNDSSLFIRFSALKKIGKEEILCRIERVISNNS